MLRQSTEVVPVLMKFAHTTTPCQIATIVSDMNIYATKVLAVALSYLQVGGRTPTVL